MKLLSYQINGETIGTQKKYWNIGELNDNEPFLFSETIVNGYIDITTIKNIDEFGFLLKTYDYKFARDIIKNIVKQKAIDNTLGTETDDRSILSPNIGDKYLVGDGGVKGFRYQDGLVAEWDGTDWVFSLKEHVGFDFCNSEEKNICLEHKIGNLYQRLITAGSMKNLVNAGLLYHAKMIGLDFSAVRPLRLSTLISITHNYTEHLNVELTTDYSGLSDNSGLSILNTPPLLPNIGDKVIVGNDGNGVFDGNEKDIAEWDGSNWIFTKRTFLPMPTFIFGLAKNKEHNYLEDFMYGLMGSPMAKYGDTIDGLLNMIDCNIGSGWHISNGKIGIRNFGYIFPTMLPKNLGSWSELADIMLSVAVSGTY